MTDKNTMTTNAVAYLDYNASAPVRARVVEAVQRAMAFAGNPSSVHRAGRGARAVVENARRAVAELVNAQNSSEVVFTSGGTEANNLALVGGGQGHLYASAVEHPSVLEVQMPGGTTIIPVDSSGVVDVDIFKQLSENAAPGSMVSVMLANNETGVVQPIARIAEVAHGRGLLVHCDAVQAVGKIPVDMAELGVDLVTLSAHKIGGPQGVGALVVREGVNLAPQIKGGGQERDRRAGTENVAGIAGFAIAAQEVSAEAVAYRELMRKRDDLERRMCAMTPGAEILGANATRLPNTTCITLPGVDAEVQVMALDLAGVLISSGSACSSGKVGPSHVLAAMGVAPEIAQTAIRISQGRMTTEQDLDRLLEAWAKLNLRSQDHKLDQGAVGL